MALDDPGPETEAVGEVRGDVELGAAHVDLALRRLAERDNARVETVVERPERDEIECGSRLYIQPISHGIHLASAIGCPAWLAASVASWL